MFLIKVVYAMLCVCVFLCPSSFIVGSPSYLLSILIQNGIQANSHHQIYFDVASIVRPFFFYKTFFKTPDHKWLIFPLKSPSKLGFFYLKLVIFKFMAGFWIENYGSKCSNDPLKYFFIENVLIFVWNWPFGNSNFDFLSKMYIDS